MIEMTKENEEKFDQLCKRFWSRCDILIWLAIACLPLALAEALGPETWRGAFNTIYTFMLLAIAVIFFGGMGYMMVQAKKLGLRPKRN